MADMGEGFDKLVAKLQQAANLSDKIDKHWANIAKNAAATGTGGGGASGTNASKGGQKNNGGGKNVMSGFGGSGSFDHGSLPGVSDSYGFKKDGSLNQGGRVSQALAKKAGFGIPKSVMGPQTQEQQALIDSNAARISSFKNAGQGAYLAARGISKSSFDAMAPASQANIASSMYGLGDTISLMSGLSSASNTMMPEVQATMDRVTGYYNAGVRGGTTRAAVESATFNTLSKGMTSVGSDAKVAQYLTGRGMSVSGAAGSTYQQTVNSVANAGRYMNISNEQAATSVEGLTSASGAANMLKNFGIYTADLKTGKEKSQGQIFEELAARLTAGRGAATQEQTQNSIRRGSLGVTIDSFFQGDTQGASMFKQYMIDRSKGGSASSWDAGTGTSISGDKNPLTSQMAMNASDTSAMASAQEMYIKGIGTATKALQALNAVVGGLASTIAGASTAMTQTLFGANSVKGIAGGLTTTVNFAGKAASGIGQALMGMDALNPAPALAEAGIIAGSAGTSFATATLASGALMGAAAGFGGGTTGFGSGTTGDNGVSTNTGFNLGNSISSGIQSGIDFMTGTSPLFDTAELRSHGKKTRGPENGHKGYDLPYHWNTPVLAFGDGVVGKCRRDYNKQDNATSLETVSGSLGNYVTIHHTAADGTQYTSLYGHLKSVSVTEGDKVSKGQEIGRAGNTGGTWPLEQNNDHGGTHLHFEISKGDKTPGQGAPGVSLNPMDLGGVLEDKSKAQSWIDSLANPTSPTSSNDSGPNGSTSDPNNSGSMYGNSQTSSVKGAASSMQSQISNLQGKASGAMSILSNLYSGDQTKMQNAVSAMATSYGMTSSQLDYYLNPASTSSSQYLPASGSPSGGTLTPPSSTQGAQSVNITVQVPDVTSADAVKFAQLVKQYLDDSSLLSNMGSN